MKFFFCEKCGKRITDAQIDEGAAKDKKLRGVYCKECAEGVLTMETLPLSDSEAKELLKEESPQKSTSDKRPPPLKDMRAGRTSARRQQSARAPVASPRQPPIMLIIGGAIALLLAVVGWQLMSGGNSQTVQKKRRRPSAGVAASPKSGEIRESRPRKSPDTKPVSTKKTEEAEQPDPAKETPVTPPDPAGVAVPVQKDGKGTSAAPNDSPPLNSEPEPEKTEAPKRDEPADPQKPDEKQIQARRQKAFAAHWPAFLDAISQRDWDRAIKAAEAFESHEALKDQGEALAALKPIARKSESASGARKRSLDALKGKKIKLSPLGKKAAEITDIKDGQIHYRIGFSINNQMKYRTGRFAVSELSAGDWEQVHKPELPKDDEGWLARAVTQLADKDTTGARSSLVHTKHPLTVYLQAVIDQRIREGKEAAAGEAWNAISDLAGAKKWKETARALDAFKKEFAGLDFLEKNAAEIQRTEDAILNAIARARGFSFDLKTPADAGRILKLFKIARVGKMTVKPEAEGIAIRRGKLRGDGKPPGVILQNDSTLGTNWTLELVLRVAVRKGRTHSGPGGREQGVNLCFPKQGVRLLLGKQHHARLMFAIRSGYNGLMNAGLRGDRQVSPNKPGEKDYGTFAGISSKGILGGNLLAQPKGGQAVKAPADALGRYHLKVSMNETAFKFLINDQRVLDEELTRKGAKRIASSVLTLSFHDSGQFLRGKTDSDDMVLESLRFQPGPDSTAGPTK